MRFLVQLIAFLSFGLTAHATTLTIGLSVFASSMDPHFHLTGANMALARHVFDALLAQDSRQRLHPALAEEWAPIGTTTWRFRLRDGVRSHDGTPFSAEDVAFTLRRAPNVANSPGSFAIYTRAIERVKIIDRLTIDIHTKRPNPTLPIELSTIAIIPLHLGDSVRTADFNSGVAAIGTGPFRFAEWVPGERVVLGRNDAYWGEKPAWTRIVQRLIRSDSSRVAALLAGDVDAIEYVPASAMERLRTSPKLSLASTVSNRVIFLAFDHASPTSAHATTLDGARLDTNPFKDLLVRQAISAAIDRRAIIEQVMQGFGLPAGQILPPGYDLISERLVPEPYDPDRARRLLAAAGLAGGFAVNLLAPNDRYVNDEQVAQAIGQMLARIGIRARIDPVPGSIVLQRLNRTEFGVVLWGWGSETGEPIAALRALLGTRSTSGGSGTANRGRYSNPSLDLLLDRAGAEIDREKLRALAADATELAIADLALIPLYFQAAIWALRSGLTMEPRADSYTLAFEIKPTR